MGTCKIALTLAVATLALACDDSYQRLASVKLASDGITDVVIRQVYGGGSNSSAVFAHDFIEIFNRGQSTASFSGWSLQYASATGTGNFGANATQLTELPDITLAPGQSFLVQQAGTGTVGNPLPTPDFVDPTPINIGATGGKVALVQSATSLGCNGSSTPCAAAAVALIVDLVGYGSANFAEGSPAPATDNTTAVVRQSNGCADTNLNAADFLAATPVPLNSASPVVACVSNPGTGGSGGAPGSGGALGTGGTGGGAGAGGAGGTPEPGPVRIHDIQGRAHRSPMEGVVVDRVPGVVTHVASNGFYLQDLLADSEPATSEGIFVFTSSSPAVAVGDSVLVTGPVTEFRPGCSGCGPSSNAYANLTTTEIERPTSVVRLAGGQPLPEPVVLGPSGRMPPTTIIDDDGVASVEDPTATFSPELDGIDFYESVEGMRVQVDDAVAVGPTNGFGELPVLATRGVGAGLRSARGGIVVAQGDFNPERIILDSDSMPQANVGDSFAGSVVGVLDYSFGNFKLLPTAPLPALTSGGLAPEQVQLGGKAVNDLDIASLNVENLDPSDPAEKFASLAQIVVSNLGAPDLISLEEVQDDSGPVNDQTVSALATLRKLTDAIVAAGGPPYESRSIDPMDGQDGGEPSGNIRVVLLFRTDRGLSFVDRPGATATTANAVVAAGARPQLTFSPGRINPTDPAFTNSRKPLAAEFEFNGQRLFVVANHFNSKGGDQPLFGRFQPPTLASETQRLGQAGQVAAFVSAIQAIDTNAKVVVLGDLNDFEFSAPIAALEASGLTTLVRTLPADERYSYVYDGNSQVLDHILVSASLRANLRGFDIVHVNAEFAAQSSDHDPAVARLAVGPLPTQSPIPILDCVERLGALNWLAHFGYDNPNGLPVSRTVGSANRFVPAPNDRGQPTTFLPGRQRDVVRVPFRGGLVAWWLGGRTALATALSPRCP